MAKRDWFEIWFDDKQSIIETMVRNMQADLDAGYDPNGHSIKQQKFDLAMYKSKLDEQMAAFVWMTDGQVARWCYYDLKKRGAIA